MGVRACASADTVRICHALTRLAPSARIAKGGGASAGRAGRDIRIPLVLAVAAFVLAFIQRPGLATSDTKIDLHVDPVRFLADVASAAPVQKGRRVTVYGQDGEPIDAVTVYDGTSELTITSRLPPPPNNPEPSRPKARKKGLWRRTR